MQLLLESSQWENRVLPEEKHLKLTIWISPHTKAAVVLIYYILTSYQTFLTKFDFKYRIYRFPKESSFEVYRSIRLY